MLLLLPGEFAISFSPLLPVLSGGEITMYGHFSGGSVGKTASFHRRATGSVCGWGPKIPHAVVWPENKERVRLPGIASVFFGELRKHKLLY